VLSLEHSYCFDAYNKTFSDTSNLNEALLYIFGTCNGVNILLDMCVCVCVQLDIVISFKLVINLDT